MLTKDTPKNDVSQENFTIIDNEIFEAPLSSSEKMAFIVLTQHAWNDNKVFPSQKVIASDASLSIDTISRALSSLKNKNFISFESGKNKGASNIYHLEPFQINDQLKDTNNMVILRSSRGTAERSTPPAMSSRRVPQRAGHKNTNTKNTNKIISLNLNTSISLNLNTNKQNSTSTSKKQNFKTKKKVSYTTILNWIFKKPLSFHEKLVYIALKMYAGVDNKIFPSQKTIAFSTSLSVSTVSRALSSLENKGYTKIISGKKKGTSNNYHLNPFQPKNASPNTKVIAIPTNNNTSRNSFTNFRSKKEILSKAKHNQTKKNNTISISPAFSNKLNQTSPPDEQSFKIKYKEIVRIIFDEWTIMFGPNIEPPKINNLKMLRKVDYMLVCTLKGLIKPRLPLLYLSKVTPPDKGWESIITLKHRQKEAKQKQSEKEHQHTKEQAKTKLIDTLVQKKWDALSDDKRNTWIMKAKNDTSLNYLSPTFAAPILFSKEILEKITKKTSNNSDQLNNKNSI